MKIAVISAEHPFAVGGAEILADALVEHLRREGHDSALVPVPHRGTPYVALPKELEIARNFRLESADKIIALKFPAYFVPHDHRVVWLLHQYRGAYDLYGTYQTSIPADDRGRQMQAFLKAADDAALSSAERLFTSSPVTHDRLLRYNGLDSTVLLHPIQSADELNGGESGGYIFAGGRITPLKRQELLLEALALTSHAVHMVLAGPPDNAEYRERIERLVARLGVGDRVTLRLGFWDRSQVIDWVNHAAACAYVPYNEDSMSYFAMEAANARKAVITSSDSGGVLGLVKDGTTGWVVPPQAGAIAAAMDEAVRSPQRTRALGEAMGEYWRELDITWPSTIQRLLS